MISGGALIANDWADWTDGALLAPIDSDESGHPSTGPASFSVWTGTSAGGTALPNASDTCNEWSQYIAAGAAGSSSSTNSQWSFSATVSCNSILRLYCFEQ